MDDEPPCHPLTAWPFILSNYTAMPSFMTAGQHGPKKEKASTAFLYRREETPVGPIYDLKKERELSNTF